MTEQIDLGLEFESEDFSDAALKIRDGRFTLALKGGEPQAAVDVDDSISYFSRLAQVGSRLVLTVDQVAPSPMLPYVSGLVETETSLPIEAIDPHANGTTAFSTPSSDVKVLGDAEKAEEVGRILEQRVSTTQPTTPSISDLPVRRYRFEVNEAAFAANEPLAYATWARYFSQSGPIEIWVDDNGLVRQINTVADGEAVTVRINALGDTMHGLSAGFEGGTTLYPAGDL